MTGHACHLAQALPGVLAGGPSAAGWLAMAAEVWCGGQLPRGAELVALGKRAGMGRAATYKAAAQVRASRCQRDPGSEHVKDQLRAVLARRLPSPAAVLTVAALAYYDGQPIPAADLPAMAGDLGLTTEETAWAISCLATPRRAAS